jgi:DNA-binding MarR family transcriptional regulator
LLQLQLNKLAAYKLNVTQALALLAIHESSEPLTLTKLAKVTHTSTGNTTGIVDKLEALHLIERRRGRDRRTLQAVLTGHGWSVVEDIINH